jgi:hypothetical protein
MLWIHIGGRKTGSSTLQSFFKTNSAVLPSLGFQYPSAGLFGAAHHDLMDELRGRGTRKEGNTWAALAKSLEGPSVPAIVSSEMFEILTPEQIAKIPTFFPSDQKFTVLAVLRHPVSLLPSAYSQKTKTSANRLDFDGFFEASMAEGRVSIHQTLERWAEVFGWDAIRVRYLDRKTLYQGDLMADAVHLLAPSAAPEAVAQLERVPSLNISPGWKVVEMIRDYVNREFVDHQREGRNKEERAQRRKLKDALDRKVVVEIARELGTLEDKGLYMTRAQAERCMASFKEDAEKLNPLLVHDQIPVPADLDALGFRERSFLPGVSHISAEEREKFAVLLASYLEAHRVRTEERNALLLRRAERAKQREEKQQKGKGGAKKAA